MDRRDALGFLAAGISALALPGATQAPAPAQRSIPSTGERLPAVGLGTWLTFDVTDEGDRRARGEILRAFFESGGRLVDSSPMYGASEETIGAAMPGNAGTLFAASKVWTMGAIAGRRQMENSRAAWRVKRFDLLEVHNFLDWENHLATLRQMKAEGRVRYIGVTTSHGRRHDLAEKIMRQEKIDFVQFTYNVRDQSAEPLFPSPRSAASRSSSIDRSTAGICSARRPRNPSRDGARSSAARRGPRLSSSSWSRSRR